MVPQDGGFIDGDTRVGTVIDTLGEIQTSRRLRSDDVISEPFMRDHTAFDTFADFVDASPWSLSEPRRIDDVPRDALDDYVERTTEFQSWDEMETQAAEEAIVEQYLF